MGDKRTPSDGPMWGTLGTCGFDERPLCLHCMAPLRPDAHFCKRCMAPVSSYAGFGYFGDGNYEAIWSTGWILGKAATTPRPRRLHLWAMGLIWLPGLLLSLLWLREGRSIEGSGGVLLSLAFLALWGYIAFRFLWLTWRNYRRGPPPFVEEVFE